jgi:hypothetical protein
MPTASVTDWLILLASLAGVLLFGAAVWWALYSDRARGRRRCPKCWFDMTHTQGRRCTECGYSGATEDDLRRTRRRPVVGFLALLGCAILGARGIDHIRVSGWGPYAPTPLLVRVMDAGTAGFREADQELRRRAASDAIDTATWDRILVGAADGSPGAAVGTAAWIDRHGDWVLRAAQAILASGDGDRTRAAQQTVLAIATRYPPEIELDPPTLWPADRSIPVGVVVREPWDVPLPIRLLVDPGHGSPVAFARYGAPIQQRSFTVDVAGGTPGRHEIEISFEMDRALDPQSPWIPGAPTTARAVIEILGTPSDAETEADVDAGTEADAGEVFPPRVPDERGTIAIAVPPVPVTDPEVGAIVARVFDRGAVQWEHGSLPVRITVDRRQTAIPSLTDVAIGIEVEVRRNGELGRTLELWWMGGTISSAPNEWEVPFVDDDVLLPPVRPEDRWELVIRGREDLALRVPGATHWWAGQLTRPLVVRSRGGMAPSRGWIPVPLPESRVRSENHRPPGDATLVRGRADGERDHAATAEGG